MSLHSPRSIGLALLLGGALTACSPTIQIHGYVPPDTDVARIRPGFDDAGSIEKLLGRPSSSGVLADSAWYYVQSTVENYTYHAPKVIDRKVLAERWGAHGLRLHELAHGRDARTVNPNEARKGISCETTFNEDLSAVTALEDKLAPLCDRVARQARSGGVAGRVVTLKLRTTDFRIVTRRRTLPVATQTAHTLFKVGRELLTKEATGRPWRLIGIGIADLVVGEEAAADFFADEERRALASERSIDLLRAKFGADAVTSGRMLRARTTADED